MSFYLSFTGEFVLLKLLLQHLQSSWGKADLGRQVQLQRAAPSVSVVGAGDGPLDFSRQREITGLQHVESPHAEINPDIISPNTAKETITVSYKNNPH